jgi:hypothetical protein
MAAVSARRMRGPSDAARQPLASKSASSSGAHPPSGPMAISSCGHLLFGRRNTLLRSRCAAWWCAPARRARCAWLRKRRARALPGDRIVNQGTSERRACCGLMRDAPPALGALLRGLGQVLLRPPRDHRRNRGNAQFGGLLDGPLHAIELVDGHHQRNGQRGIGLEFGDQVEANFSAG